MIYEIRMFCAEILLKALWHSVDPYMRAFGDRMNVGDTMVGSQVAV
jgi:NADPH-dependent curcumin reductase CurA